jgi:hypothetical protein
MKEKRLRRNLAGLSAAEKKEATRVRCAALYKLRKQHKTIKAPRYDLPPCAVLRFEAGPQGRDQERNRQHYWCGKCLRSFSEATKPANFPSLWSAIAAVQRLSAAKTEPQKAGGIEALLPGLQKGFHSRRKNRTSRNHLILRKRVDAVPTTAQIREELFQQAAIDVFDGKGYCWNVSLNTITSTECGMGRSQNGSSRNAWNHDT